ncbi:MAG: arsenate reductase (glutaredoxin) [Hyphomicrobiaceae bacterium]
MTITIYHNPACSKSRTTLAMIRQSGIEPTVIAYLKSPPSRADLAELISAMGVPVRDVMRKKAEPYTTLGLDDTSLSDDLLIAAMVAHPMLIDRPIVISAKGVKLCRPPELVLTLLDTPNIGPVATDHGEGVHDAQGGLA